TLSLHDALPISLMTQFFPLHCQLLLPKILPYASCFLHFLEYMRFQKYSSNNRSSVSRICFHQLIFRYNFLTALIGFPTDLLSDHLKLLFAWLVLPSTAHMTFICKVRPFINLRIKAHPRPIIMVCAISTTFIF